jgi:hypothetical protein
MCVTRGQLRSRLLGHLLFLPAALGALLTDGALHTTLWISEWPRIDVRATFLQPSPRETDLDARRMKSNGG